MTIPAGYRLAVIAPSGTILDIIDLEGADLAKPLGAAELGLEVAAVIEREHTVKAAQAVTNPHQHCTNPRCELTTSHTAELCGTPQPRRCGCAYCYPAP